MFPRRPPGRYITIDVEFLFDSGKETVHILFSACESWHSLPKCLLVILDALAATYTSIAKTIFLLALWVTVCYAKRTYNDQELRKLANRSLNQHDLVVVASAHSARVIATTCWWLLCTLQRTGHVELLRIKLSAWNITNIINKSIAILKYYACDIDSLRISHYLGKISSD